MAMFPYDAAAKPPMQGVELHATAAKSHFKKILEPDEAVSMISTTFTKTVEQQAASMEAGKSPDNWGHVVVLVGTSTVGKTSLISEIKLSVPQLVESGVDLKQTELFLNHLENHHKNEWAFLKTNMALSAGLEKSPELIFDYIFGRKKLIYRENVSNDDKKKCNEYCEALRDSIYKQFPSGATVVEMMMEDILTTSKSGKPVIFDMLNTDNIFASTLHKEHPSLKVALVFCPFVDLTKNIIARNKKAEESNNLANARDELFPLEQFAALYGPKPPDSDVESLQTLTRKEAEDAFKMLSKEILDFKQRQNTLEDRALEEQQHEQIKTEVFVAIGFSDEKVNKVELVPKGGFKGFDYIIKTLFKPS